MTAVIVIAWLAVSALGVYVAAQKGRDRFEGWLISILFGPLGVLVEALLPAQQRKPREPKAAAPGKPRDFPGGSTMAPPARKPREGP